MKELLKSVLDVIFPRFCVCCQRRLLTGEEVICSVCNMELPRLDYASQPEDNPMAMKFWGMEVVKGAAALIRFQSKLKPAEIVYAFKYRDRPEVARYMGRMMAQEMDTILSDVDVLVPVPLAKKRLRERGYNQSTELARGIAEITRLPICESVLKRRIFIASQTNLNSIERIDNTENVFYISSDVTPLQGKRIALIDDVVTTGATTKACACELQKIPGVTVRVISFGCVI